MRVLLVDLDEATGRTLRDFFDRAGWAVDEAGHVAQGLRLLDRAPDWAVLDVGSSAEQGLSILREIRARRRPVRVAVVAGTSPRDRIEAAGELKPELMITKPIDAPLLLAVMGRATPA